MSLTKNASYIETLPSSAGLGLSIGRPFKPVETPVTLRNAIRLECLSRTRITSEIREEPKLRRIVGHLVVYQKASEVIRVNRMQQEKVRKFREEFQPMEDETWPEFLYPRRAPVPPSSPSPYAGAVVSPSPNHFMPPGPRGEDCMESGDLGERYVEQSYSPGYVQIVPANIHVHGGYGMQAHPEWMYDVLNLQVEHDGVVQPLQIRFPGHLSGSAALQLWEALMQSLSKLYHRRGQLRSVHDLGQLEAHGLQPRVVPPGIRNYTDQCYWQDSSVQWVV